VLLLARWLGGGFKLYHRTQLPWLCTTRRDGFWYGRRERNDICIARVIAVVALMRIGRRALHTHRLLMPNGPRSILAASVRTSTPDMATTSWAARPTGSLHFPQGLKCQTTLQMTRERIDHGLIVNLMPAQTPPTTGSGTDSTSEY